jgi:WXG100 family type VII secretion target
VSFVPLVKIDYEVLQHVLRLNQIEIDRIEQIIYHLKHHRDDLDGEWIGDGASAFFIEMDEYLIPRLKRLLEAQNDLQQTINHIITTMEQAEDSACTLFNSSNWF